MSKKVGGVLIKKALHIVTDATDLMYYPFRTWDVHDRFRKASRQQIVDPTHTTPHEPWQRPLDA